MDLYKEQILDHWRNPRNFKRLKFPTNACKMQNPLCGDEITVEVKVNNGKITDVGFFGNGCVISQASASMLSEEAKRLGSVKEIKKITPKKVLSLLGVEVITARQKCALLSLEVLQKALEKENDCTKDCK